MKVKVTRKGLVNDKNEPIEVGKTLTIKGDKIPAHMVNKVERVGDVEEKEPDAPAEKSGGSNEAGKNTAPAK